MVLTNKKEIFLVNKGNKQRFIYILGKKLEMEGCEAESRKVVNLPPGKNIPEGKPSSQNNGKWAWLGCVEGVS